jgi:hypothetical protein
MKHALTREDIRIIRYAFKRYEDETFAGSSGDLFDEERYAMRVALRHLPKMKDLPEEKVLATYTCEVRRSDLLAFRKWKQKRGLEE